MIGSVGKGICHQDKNLSSVPNTHVLEEEDRLMKAVH